MSAPTITCPACQKRFKGKPELVGKKIKCPGCSVPFVVPAAAEESNAPIAFADNGGPPAKAKPNLKAAIKPAKPQPAPAPTAAPEPPKADIYGLGTLDISAKCPNCAQPMENETAVICLYCGYNTLTREHGKTKKVIAASTSEHFIYLGPALACAAIFLTIVILIIFHNTIVPDWVIGKSYAWVASEPARMWPALLLTGLLWGLGYYAFNTLVLRPKPPDITKE
jgi:DNA-directed RNA polymerase subunit RPC12/RpoP